MAVYAFIATPVQLWHHHNYDAQSISSIHPAGNKKIIATANDKKTVENDCKICSHHYSFYSNDDITSFEILRATFNPKKGFYVLTIPVSPYFTFSNKGPPHSSS